MLDEQNAYDNMVNFNGYIPPQNGIDADRLISEGLIPETLAARRDPPGAVCRQPGAAPAHRRGRAALGPGVVEVPGRLVPDTALEVAR